MIQMVDIRKAFGAIRALDGACLTIKPNEVLGLVGNNAAGKSTLMKVLSGAYSKDGGTILLDNTIIEINSPRDARHAGIEMVYQDLALADNLDVIANIFMGREIERGIFLNSSAMEIHARNLINKLGIDIKNIKQPVETLSGGQRQSVAIARSTAFNARLVIMDEPTANLSPASAEHVLDIIRQLKLHNVSVVLISHRIDEVTRISDRVVTMEHGKILDA